MFGGALIVFGGVKLILICLVAFK